MEGSTLSTLEPALRDKQVYEKRLTSYYLDLYKRTNKEKVKEFADFRKFDINTVNKCGIFYIGEMAEMLLPQYIDEVSEFGVISPTNNMPIFKNRWVIPIKNESGLVENFVGYSPNADERYIYGTARYYQRRETLWGLENLHKAYEMGYAFVTEGITDAIRLRDLGYENAFAMCGTHSSEFIMQQLNRCRYGVIRIPDRDDPGLRALKNWKCNRNATLYINFQYKDIDALCAESKENQEWARDYLNACVDWIKTEEHKGQQCICESVTML